LSLGCFWISEVVHSSITAKVTCLWDAKGTCLWDTKEEMVSEMPWTQKVVRSPVTTKGTCPYDAKVEMRLVCDQESLSLGCKV
jgi:hypothetical protein